MEQIKNVFGKLATCEHVLVPSAKSETKKTEYCGKPAVRLGSVQPGTHKLEYLCEDHANWLPNQPDAPRGGASKLGRQRAAAK